MPPRARTLIALTATALLAIAVAPPAVAGDDELPVNATLKSKFPAEGMKGNPGLGSHILYYSAVKVRLSEGQRVTIEASSNGDKLGVALTRPDGKVAKSNFPDIIRPAFGDYAADGYHSACGNADCTFGKSASVPSGLIPADGVYTVHLYSGDPGSFTLVVKDPTVQRGAPAVRKELEQAEAKVAALKQELEALERKK